MFNDLAQLQNYLKQRGTQTNVETFYQEQVAKAQNLPDLARDLMLAALNRHPLYPENYGFYQGQPIYIFAANIIQEAENGGKTLWDLPDFANIWQKTVLPQAWLAPTNRLWHMLNIDQKLGLLFRFSNDWIFHEAQLIELVEFSDVYFNTGFFELLSLYFAEAINAGDQNMAQKIRATLTQQAADGQIAVNLVRASVTCKDESTWQFIAQLLVAAEQQEAIRQIIIREIPGAGPSVRILLLETILEHNMQRLVPVAIELNNWFKLPLADGTLYDENNIETELALALRFLKADIDAASVTQNDNLLEVYFALWALNARLDERIWDFCTQLMQQSDPEKRAMALYALLPQGTAGFEFIIPYLQDNDWSVRWNLYKHFLNHSFAPESAHLPASWDFFERLVNDLSKPALSNAAPRFTWDAYQFDVIELINYWVYRIVAQTGRYMDLLPYRKRMDANLRSGIFNGHFQPARQLIYEGKADQFNPNAAERQWIVETIQDTSANVCLTAFDLFEVLTPTPDELAVLYKLLSRKTESVRKKALGVLFKLPENQLKTAIIALLNLNDEDQQLAGLDLLQQLKNQQRLLDFVKEQALAFSQQPNIGTKAELILKDLLDESIVYNALNGYGIFDPAKARITPVLQKPIQGFFVEQMFGKPMFGLSISLEKLKDALQQLDALFIANENYAYDIENWDKSTQTVLISAPYFQRKKQFNYMPTYSESLENLPLPEVWEGWLQATGLTAMDRFLLTGYQSQSPFFGGNTIPQWLIEFVQQYTQNYINPLFFENQLGLKYPNHGYNLLTYLRDDASIQEQIQQLQIDTATHFFASIPPERMYEKFTLTIDNPTQMTWRDAWSTPYYTLQQWEYQNDQLGMSLAERLPEAQFKQYWAASHWFYCTLEENQRKQGWNGAQAFTVNRAYELGLFGKDAVYDLILTTGLIGQIYYYPPVTEKRLLDSSPIFNTFYAEAIPQFLSIELERGDTPTSVSEFVAFFKNIKGVAYFLQILKGLGNDSLHRGYSWGGASKKMQFSRLLKNCYPAETDSYDDFKKALETEEFTQKRLLEAALYAPQWLSWMAQYLNWPGLESAAWCLHAHGTTYLDLEKESKLAQYTSIPLHDFKYGAVDIQWFRDAFHALGADRWEMVYAAAHYISQNQGYIRARLFADAILGKLSQADCQNKISDKRNKDYIVALGLLPLSAATREQDILARFQFLQDFLEDGKQTFPSRQGGEKRAVDISIENLARNAEYGSPVRLIWAMEILALQQLMERVQSADIGDYTFSLVSNQLGIVKIVVFKGGKEMSGVPTSLKGEPIVQALIATQNNLNKQRKRIFRELESAMILSDEFLLSEIQNLMEHPVLQPLLKNLVLVCDGKNGFFRDGRLENPAKETTSLDENKPIRIAHPYDLNMSGIWSAYQSDAFQAGLVQPFKQIFRELYLLEAEEMNAIGVSKRYAGLKVQPTQAAALFRARGWSASYYDGMQAVYHRYRIVATAEAYADWINPGSSPYPVDIQGVRFTRQLTYESLPLKEIPSHVFSEVMRDLDLVVTVAHAAGVIVMAGKPTLEIRAILVHENAQRRGLQHRVQVDAENVYIQALNGTQYTVHLNSGAAYRNDSQLVDIQPEVLPSKSKVFLPFAEKDEVALELIRRVFYLAG